MGTHPVTTSTMCSLPETILMGFFQELQICVHFQEPKLWDSLPGKKNLDLFPVTTTIGTLPGTT